jgi:hypothetical protein
MMHSPSSWKKINNFGGYSDDNLIGDEAQAMQDELERVRLQKLGAVLSESEMQAYRLMLEDELDDNDSE